ncbi:MAG: hypothetical protein ACO2OO_00415 [Candidatus Aenigmatarchaeota archaeon]
MKSPRLKPVIQEYEENWIIVQDDYKFKTEGYKIIYGNKERIKESILKYGGYCLELRNLKSYYYENIAEENFIIQMKKGKILYFTTKENKYSTRYCFLFLPYEPAEIEVVIQRYEDFKAEFYFEKRRIKEKYEWDGKDMKIIREIECYLCSKFKNENEFIRSCSLCNEYYGGHNKLVDVCIECAEKEGYKIIKNDNNYEVICPYCVENQKL